MVRKKTTVREHEREKPSGGRTDVREHGRTITISREDYRRAQSRKSNRSRSLDSKQTSKDLISEDTKEVEKPIRKKWTKESYAKNLSSKVDWEGIDSKDPYDIKTSGFAISTEDAIERAMMQREKVEKVVNEHYRANENITKKIDQHKQTLNDIFEEGRKQFLKELRESSWTETRDGKRVSVTSPLVGRLYGGNKVRSKAGSDVNYAQNILGEIRHLESEYVKMGQIANQHSSIDTYNGESIRQRDIRKEIEYKKEEFLRYVVIVYETIKLSDKSRFKIAVDKRYADMQDVREALRKERGNRAVNEYIAELGESVLGKQGYRQNLYQKVYNSDLSRSDRDKLPAYNGLRSVTSSITTFQSMVKSMEKQVELEKRLLSKVKLNKKGTKEQSIAVMDRHFKNDDGFKIHEAYKEKGSVVYTDGRTSVAYIPNENLETNTHFSKAQFDKQGYKQIEVNPDLLKLITQERLAGVRGKVRDSVYVYVGGTEFGANSLYKALSSHGRNQRLLAYGEDRPMILEKDHGVYLFAPIVKEDKVDFNQIRKHFINRKPNT